MRTRGDRPALFVGVLGNRLPPTVMATTFRRYVEAPALRGESA
jgi:hypothetical protein